jgi:hypothetical protein
LGLFALVVSLWLASVSYSPATVMSICTESFLAIYPAVLVRGRLAVTETAFQPRWPHSSAAPWTPWADVTDVELRRGLFLEKVRITTDRTQVLFTPVRFRHRADPVFDAAVAELADRSGCPPKPAPSHPRPGWVAAFLVLWLACLAFATTMNAPWNDASWPWLHEAGRLPDACSGFSATALTLLPAGHETPDADLLLMGPIARQKGCTWRSGAIDTFSVGLGLTHKDLFHSACATAHDGFTRTVTGARLPDRTARPLAGLGDEARELAGGGARAGRTAIDVIARRANVIVTVRLITTHPAPDVQRTVAQIARATLAKIALG